MGNNTNESGKGGTDTAERGGADPGERSTSVRVSLNLPGDVVDVLKEIAAKEGRTMTEVIRRGIEMEKFMADLRERSAKILVKEGKETREVIIK